MQHTRHASRVASRPPASASRCVSSGGLRKAWEAAGDDTKGYRALHTGIPRRSGPRGCSNKATRAMQGSPSAWESREGRVE